MSNGARSPFTSLYGFLSFSLSRGASTCIDFENCSKSYSWNFRRRGKEQFLMWIRLPGFAKQTNQWTKSTISLYKAFYMLLAKEGKRTRARKNLLKSSEIQHATPSNSSKHVKARPQKKTNHKYNNNNQTEQWPMWTQKVLKAFLLCSGKNWELIYVASWQEWIISLFPPQLFRATGCYFGLCAVAFGQFFILPITNNLEHWFMLDIFFSCCCCLPVHRFYFVVAPRRRSIADNESLEPEYGSLGQSSTRGLKLSDGIKLNTYLLSVISCVRCSVYTWSNYVMVQIIRNFERCKFNLTKYVTPVQSFKVCSNLLRGNNQLWSQFRPIV